MIDIFQAQREAIRLAMADETNGFNAQLQALSGQYDIDPYVINWTARGSNSFMQAFLVPDEIEKAHPIDRYPCAVLYGAEAAQTNAQKFTDFSGEISLSLDFYLRLRQLTDRQPHPVTPGGDYEALGDATIDAMLSALRAAGQRPPGLRIVKDPVLILGDGPAQRIGIQLNYTRHI